MKKIIICFLLIILLPGILADLTLVDVTESGDACIFDIDGNTVVVEKGESVRELGWIIFVHKVYPAHTEAEASDVCKFAASQMGTYKRGGKNVSKWVKKTKRQPPLKINRNYTPRKNIVLIPIK